MSTSTYDRMAHLPLTIEGYSLEELSFPVTRGFTRVTTTVHLRGAGHVGSGEDVIYEEGDQRLHLDAGPMHALEGSHTLDGFSRLLDGIDLFPGGPPEREASRHYRRWAYESAALDLALRQAELSLADALGRTAAPVNFVVSMSLGSPASIEPVRRWLDRDPDLRFKLDPDETWTTEITAGLRATGAVDAIDLKGLYVGTVVDLAPDPALYGRLAGELPNVWIEDPYLDDATRAALAGHEDRITWDANLESLADLVALDRAPKAVNIKPSRFGTVRELMAVYDHLEAAGIAAYGGGQFELGVGRGHIQYLASLFHPDTPNDVAPGGYNLVTPPRGLPGRPLPVAAAPTGFRWES